MEKAKQALLSYFESGCKSDKRMMLGLELEHFITDRATKRNIQYSETRGTEYILNCLLPFFTDSVYENGRLLGLSDGEISLTLEPGAQLEVSIAPKEKLIDVLSAYNRFKDIVDEVISPLGYELTTLGYLPHSRVGEIELIPKKRYYYMDKYFEKTGKCGINMMRGTAACQVSIDYFDESDFIKKFRCAYVLTPLFELLSGNSPVFEGLPNKNPLIRKSVWRNVDEKRTCIVNGVFDDDFGFSKYADYILSRPAIFSVKNGVYSPTDKTALEVMREYGEEELPALADHYSSMVFPDVRLRRYVEIRCADSMPPERFMFYLGLIKGIFSSSGTVDDILKGFDVREGDIEDAEDDIALKGFSGDIYGVKASRLADRITRIALENLNEDEKNIVEKGLITLAY
ncbi:MAG: hypothetical protein K6F09_02725 [Clostridiales bacterium]|nr:hypothetical protein [Clostridiales bacterium]